MKALSWNAAESLHIENRELPALQENEVRIRVEAVGICGSEIEGYLGHNSLRTPPLIMGHEFCGRVAEIGPGTGASTGANELELRQKVVVNPLLYCGQCDRCLRGLTQLCDRRSIIGIHRPGAFAEYVDVPRSAIVPVAETINPFRAALAEPLACSLRATRRALHRQSLGNVIVFGAGGIGLLCAMTARILGAPRIMIVDTNTERLRIAGQLQIDAWANPRTDSVEQQARHFFGLKGIDVVIDAAGFQATREEALKLLNPGGTLMNIGLGIDDTRLPMNQLTRNEIEILGSFCYTNKDFLDSVELLVSGRITEEGWTEVRPLSEGSGAFADLVRGNAISGKIFLQP